MAEGTVCFSGHRLIPPQVQKPLADRLEALLVQLIESGHARFCAGGALGFDTLAAQTVLRLKECYPHIRLILVLPCRTQSHNWSAANRAVYDHILCRADEIVYTSDEYTNWCMQKRDRYLVDHSDICVCYLTKTTGGTAYTVDYARKKGLSVINLPD